MPPPCWLRPPRVEGRPEYRCICGNRTSRPWETGGGIFLCKKIKNIYIKIFDKWKRMWHYIVTWNTNSQQQNGARYEILKDELIAEYGFTEEEAEDVAADLAAMEADAQ